MQVQYLVTLLSSSQNTRASSAAVDLFDPSSWNRDQILTRVGWTRRNFHSTTTTTRTTVRYLSVRRTVFF